jgi:FixJ family two-component response regulator
MSGYTDDAIVNHGILEGRFPFLDKPFSKDSLLAKVREVLDG